MKRRSWIITVSAIMAAVVLAAGCSRKPEEPTTTPAPTTTAPTTEEATKTEPETTEESTEASGRRWIFRTATTCSRARW